jgi:tetratricopeptide (TPR) repeat protein
MRALLTLAWLCLSWACATPERRVTAEDIAVRATRAEERGDWLAAGELWQGLNDDPRRRNVASTRGLARALEAQGELASAINVLASVAAPDAALQIELGDLHLRRGARDRARVAWERARDLDPGSIPARRRLARAWLEHREYARALEVLREAVALAPREANLWADFATAALGADRPVEALQAHLALGELRELEGAEALTVGRLILAAEEHEHFATAEAWLSRGMERNPTWAAGWRTLAELRRGLGDDGGAIDAWQAALESDPADTDSLVLLGEALAAAGEWPRVEALARHAAKLASTRAVLRFEQLLARRPPAEEVD